MDEPAMSSVDVEIDFEGDEIMGGDQSFSLISFKMQLELKLLVGVWCGVVNS